MTIVTIRLLWFAEETGIYCKRVGGVARADNAAGNSFQKATNPNTQLKAIFDLRDQWVKVSVATCSQMSVCL